MQARSQEVRGNKDYVESPWLSDMAELAEAELAPPPPHSKAPQVDVRGFEGKLRKTSCSSFGMGMKVTPSILLPVQPPNPVHHLFPFDMHTAIPATSHQAP